MSSPVRGTPSLMRAINDRATLRALLESGSLTRPQIVALTGLSKPTASQLLARLQEIGLVISDGVRSGRTGRSAEAYRINPAAAQVAAMDVTPERVEVQIADLTGTVIGAATLPATGPTPDPVTRLRAALAAADPPGELDRLVIGVQGAVNPATGRLDYATDEDMPGWQIPDLAPSLSQALGVPVVVENDVNLVALAEQAHGAAAGSPDFVLLWADEGLGAALMLGGRLHRGATGGSGEVGYLPAPGAPTAREVGRFGHHGYQALAGGPAIQKLLAGHGISAPDFRQAVANAARQAVAGDAAATTGLREVAERLAVGLAEITAVLDPGLIVLAGGLALAGGEVLRELVELELHALTIPRPPLRLSTVEGNPVLAGALDLGLGQVRDELFGAAIPAG
ncbi:MULTISPECIES: ROK family transcriptional regulator [unclassified Crossiella]|uniref:ROK family transcriptional regulator n=1 Tax=unclassified Crossiella TaxID=2620835 RepID=UPI0020004E46|nr:MULTISPECIES: ROK family transcriptional regulator [unclassified Crossiella]MCK2243442.1 ROK family transcriptional regulator [Crossiella sp. S99.2]MCK2257300.1 ROK family transcriptional regulator [Crossiella sp. S99.1]